MTTIKIPQGYDLTPILKAHRNDTRFELEAGRYTLANAWSFDAEHDHCTLGPRCQLAGAGSGRTSIFVDGNSALHPDAHQIICLSGGGRSGACRDIEISGVNILCPPPPEPPFRPVGIIGMQIWSDRVVIDDVTIHGITGSRSKIAGAPSSEGFGILLNQPKIRGWTGRSRVRDVVIECGRNQGRDEIYVTGFYPGYVEPEDSSEYENILVSNRTSEPASVAFGLNSGVGGRSWKCTGRWTRGIYCDVSGGAFSFVSQSELHVEGTAVELHTEAGKASDWSDIFLNDSHVYFNPVPGLKFAAGLVLWSARPDQLDRAHKISRVQLNRCTLVNYGKSGLTHWAGSAVGNVSDCGLFHCQLVGQWEGQSTNNPGFKVI